VTELPLNESGAPSTLRWLEATEAKSRARHEELQEQYEAACADSIARPASRDGTEFDKVEAAAKRQLEYEENRLESLQKRLREYTKAVPEEKRDATEKLTRNQVESFLESLNISLLQFIEQFIDSMCVDLRACKTPEEIHKLIAVKVKECMANSLENSIREGHLPEWFKNSVEILL